MKFTIKTCCFILIISLLSTCRPDDSLNRLKRTSWTPQVAVPIASANISIEEILNASDNSAIGVDDNNILTIGYSSTIFSKTGEQLFPLFDKYVHLLPGEKNIEILFSEWFGLQSIEFKQGLFEFELVDGEIDSVGTLRLDFPALKINDSGYQYESTATKFALQLDNSILVFGDGENLNRADIQYSVFDKDGLDITSNYRLLLRFRQLVFRRAKGWFDNLILDFDQDTIELDIFEKWRSGSVYLDDPKAVISATNSIGIPFTASIETFDASNHAQGTTIIPIQYQNAIGDSFVFDYPKTDDILGYANSIYELNKSNSNIQNVIEITPDQIKYEFNLVAHHKLELDEPGFINDTGRLEIKTAIEMPFVGRIDGVTIIDTMPITVKFLKELEKVEEAQLFIQTDNSLPMGIDLQILILDDNGLVLDSIFTESNILLAAQIDEQGYSAKSSVAKTSIKTSKPQLESLKVARYLLVNGVVNTSNNGQSTVKFEPQNSLKVDVSMVAKYNVI